MTKMGMVKKTMALCLKELEGMLGRMRQTIRKMAKAKKEKTTWVCELGIPHRSEELGALLTPMPIWLHTEPHMEGMRPASSLGLSCLIHPFRKHTIRTFTTTRMTRIMSAGSQVMMLRKMLTTNSSSGMSLAKSFMLIWSRILGSGGSFIRENDWGMDAEEQERPEVLQIDTRGNHEDADAAAAAAGEGEQEVEREMQLQVDVLPESVPMGESQWKALGKTYAMGAEFRVLADQRVLVWEASAATIDAELEAVAGGGGRGGGFKLTVVVKGLEEGYMIAVRHEHIPHWFEWCRVNKSTKRKKHISHLDIELEFDTSAPLQKVITLQERSLAMLRDLGVAVSIDPDEGIVFEGRKITGPEEIARALISSAVRKDDAGMLETVHYTLVHSRLLYLSRGHIAQILLRVLASATKTPHPKIDDLICDHYTSLGEKAILTMADMDVAQHDELHPLPRWILQRPLCPHKQDLRDGTLSS